MFKDYSSWEIYDGFSEGSGRSSKIWLKNPSDNTIGLFKYKKSEQTTDNISEKIAFDLANLLEIPCSRIEIGKYKGHEGSMSYLINIEGENLIEGIWLINKYFPSYSAEKMYGRDNNCNKYYYSLDMLIKAIEEYRLLEDLLNMLVFDYLIGNSDRHQNNWAIISKPNEIYTFSPLYDNSSSLCCYVPDNQIKDILGKDRNRFNALVTTKSRSIVRLDGHSKKRPEHQEVLRYLCDFYYEKISHFIKRVKLKITNDNINKILSEYDDIFLTIDRKKLIKSFVLKKVEILLQIVNEREEDKNGCSK